jgi:hypothetical protein
MSLTIQDFYEQVLTGLRYQIDPDGLISLNLPDGSIVPATVEKRRLVMPTKERLRQGITDDVQAFHPLSENIARKGASPVQSHMQRTAKAMLAHYVLEIATKMLAVAADPSKHKNLSPECGAYLKKVANADKKSVEDFIELTDRAVGKNKLLTLYLKNGGKLGDEKFNRLCVIHFPIFNLFDSPDESVLGVKLRKKDRKTFRALMEHILPGGDDPEFYSAGSNSRIAPYFEAFLRAYGSVAEQLNRIIHKYGASLGINLPLLATTYLEPLDDLGQFYNQIPSLRGNEGNLGPDQEEAPAAAPTAKAPASGLFNRINEEAKPTLQGPAPTIPQAGYGQTSAPAPARPEAGKVSMDEWRRLNQPQQLPPPAAPAYGQPTPGYGQPAPGYGQPPAYGYPAAPAYDPRRPAFLVGQPAPMAPPNPFAQALAPQAPQPAVQSYGSYSGVSNFGYSGGGSRLL